MAELVGMVLGSWKGGVDWKTALGRANELCRRYRRPHALPSVARLVVGLLYGGLKCRETICTTVMAGGDPDCTGAGAGSIVGVRVTRDGIPADLLEPVGDRIRTPVLGYHDTSVRALVEQIGDVALSPRDEGRPSPLCPACLAP
jgi:hypothetical protein